MRGVKQRDAIGLALGECSEGAIEVKHRTDKLIPARFAPIGPRRQAVAQLFILADQGQCVDCADIASFLETLVLVGIGRSEEEQRPATLTDVRRQPEPEATKAPPIVLRRIHLWHPEEVLIEDDGFGEGADQLERERRLARPAGARDDQKWAQDDGVPVATAAQHHLTLNRSLVRPLPAIGANEEHSSHLPHDHLGDRLGGLVPREKDDINAARLYLLPRGW